jgi:hypothetical protein
MNFTAARKPKRTSITIGSEKREVAQAPLGRFFELQEIARRDDPLMMIDYVAVALDESVETIENLPGGQVIRAYASLRELNRHEPFPFQRAGTRGKVDPLDYEGRGLAQIVHTIAKTYNWSRESIYNLSVDEAFAYILEILVDEHHARNWQYDLSQIGFDKEGKKKPFPKLPWSWSDRPSSDDQAKVIRLEKTLAERVGLIPSGLTIDLAEVYRKAA